MESVAPDPLQSISSFFPFFRHRAAFDFPFVLLFVRFFLFLPPSTFSFPLDGNECFPVFECCAWAET